MTPAQRQLVRTALDIRARDRLEREAVVNPCAGCGCAHENKTRGCKTCADRFSRRLRRERGRINAKG